VRYAAYKSLLDKLNDKLPYGNFYHSLFIAGFLYSVGLIISFLTGEQRAFLLDYASAAMIFGIAYMVYMETRIGNDYRVVAGEIFDVFEYDSTDDFRLIFNNRLRASIGLVVSLVLTWIFFQDLYGDVWYQSWPLRAYLAVLVAVIGFIGGEASVGVIATVRYVRRIVTRISSAVDVFEPKHMLLLMSITRWGSELSAFGGIAASVLLVALFFAPWKNGVSVVSGLGSVFLIGSVIILVLVFTTTLVRIHDIMRSSKDEMLGSLNKTSGALLRKLQSLVVEEGADPTAQEMAQLNVELDSLDKVKGLIKSLPEWPLDLGMAHTFFSAIAAPIVVYVVQVLVARFFH
jgi:hypothetical protein